MACGIGLRRLRAMGRHVPSHPKRRWGKLAIRRSKAVAESGDPSTTSRHVIVLDGQGNDDGRGPDS
jgi:hypothetical protein